MLICSECGQERDPGRKMCRECFLSHKRKEAKKRFDIVGRYNYQLKCQACKADFIGCRKSSILCPGCYYESRKKDSHTNMYVYDPDSYKELGHIWQHRAIAERILGRELKSHEVVHHMDDNPRNNAITNLLVISRVMHGRLHLYLDQQRVILEKSRSENSENCWNNLIVPMTTAWLETTGAKVIKIWEIGQSAAEPLLNEEGSETKHGTPDHSVEGDDIVQTTTERAGEIPE